MYNATKFPFCQEKNDYSDMDEKSHAEIVMNKKRWDERYEGMLGWQQEGLIPIPK